MKYILLLLVGICYSEDLVMPKVPNWAFKPVLHTSPTFEHDAHTLPAILNIAIDYIYVDGTGKVLETKYDVKYVDRDSWLATHGAVTDNELAIYVQTGCFKRTVFICVGVY